MSPPYLFDDNKFKDKLDAVRQNINDNLQSWLSTNPILDFPENANIQFPKAFIQAFAEAVAPILDEKKRIPLSGLPMENDFKPDGFDNPKTYHNSVRVHKYMAIPKGTHYEQRQKNLCALFEKWLLSDVIIPKCIEVDPDSVSSQTPVMITEAQRKRIIRKIIQTDTDITQDSDETQPTSLLNLRANVRLNPNPKSIQAVFVAYEPSKVNVYARMKSAGKKPFDRDAFLKTVPKFTTDLSAQKYPVTEENLLDSGLSAWLDGVFSTIGDSGAILQAIENTERLVTNLRKENIKNIKSAFTTFIQKCLTHPKVLNQNHAQLKTLIAPLKDDWNTIITKTKSDDTKENHLFEAGDYVDIVDDDGAPLQQGVVVNEKDGKVTISSGSGLITKSIDLVQKKAPAESKPITTPPFIKASNVDRMLVYFKLPGQPSGLWPDKPIKDLHKGLVINVDKATTGKKTIGVKVYTLNNKILEVDVESVMYYNESRYVWNRNNGIKEPNPKFFTHKLKAYNAGVKMAGGRKLCTQRLRRCPQRTRKTGNTSKLRSKKHVVSNQTTSSTTTRKQ